MWMNNFISPAKVIHTVGVVGRVEWRDLGGHDYSGIFKGAQHGLARWVSVSSTTSAFSPRLSLALEPDTSKLNTAPGMGLKFLRDGMDSANLVAMYSVDGQESWNFFKNDFSNHIPRFDYYYHVDGDLDFDDKTVQYWCRKIPALKGAKVGKWNFSKCDDSRQHNEAITNPCCKWWHCNVITTATMCVITLQCSASPLHWEQPWVSSSHQPPGIFARFLFCKKKNRRLYQHQHTFYLPYLSLGFILQNVVFATVDWRLSWSRCLSENCHTSSGWNIWLGKVWTGRGWGKSSELPIQAEQLNFQSVAK